MKKVGPMILSAFAGLVLASAMWALPTAADNPVAYLNAATSQDTPQTQSVSGKIASVDKYSFVLTVASDSSSSQGQSFAQDTKTKMMTFVIDKNTTVDGKLKVSASADVTYRLDTNGNNIAVSVRVAP